MVIDEAGERLVHMTNHPPWHPNAGRKDWNHLGIYKSREKDLSGGQHSLYFRIPMDYKSENM